MKKIATLFLIGFSISVFSQKRIQEFSDVTSFTSLGDKVYVAAYSLDKGSELWVFDEATQKMELLKDIIPGQGSSSPSSLITFNNNIYFAADDRVHGAELWKTDGTEGNTTMLKDLVPGYRQSSNPKSFKIHNNQMYFLASNATIQSYADIWVTDGTESGTQKLFETGSSYTSIIIAGDHIYSLRGFGLVKYSIQSGTGTIINLDNSRSYSNLRAYNDEIYLTGTSYSSGDISILKLNSSDNLDVIKEFAEPSGGDIEIDNVIVALDKLFFTIREDFSGSNDRQTIWKSDGTESGTVEVRSFLWQTFLSNSDISSFYEFNGKLYFKASYDLNETAWETDGEASGTRQAYAVGVNRDAGFIGLGNKLFFGSGTGSNLIYHADVSTSEPAKLFINYNLTNANFFKGKSDNFVYFEFRNNGSLGNYPYYFYNSELRPNMKFTVDNFTVDTEYVIQLETALNKVGRKEIKIENTGNADLVFSSIEIVGNGLYLDNFSINNQSTENPEGIIPQVIPPGEEYSFGVYFYPWVNEFGNGTITINSNSGESLTTEFIVEGIIKEEQGDNLTGNPALDKEVRFFTADNTPLILTNQSIFENQPSNTVVGSFAAGPGSFTYEFIGSDNDNNAFTIVNDELLSSEIFDFENKNAYRIRVRATNGSDVYEEDFVVQIENDNEDQDLGECADDLVDLGTAFIDVQYITDNKVVAVGEQGVIIISEDGGETWARKESNTKILLRNVQFPSENIGYAIGEGVFLKTEDGGNSWFQLRIPVNFFDHPEDVFFIDDNTGYAFGQSDGDVFKTTNGGVNWVRTQIAFSNDIRAGHFFDTQRGYMVGTSGLFKETTDGGSTWQDVSLNISGLSSSATFQDIQFLNNDLGFVLVSSGDIIRTQDSGQTWEIVGDLNISGGYTLKFRDSSIGYVFTEFPGYYETTDGGQTWDFVSMDFALGVPQEVDFHPTSNKPMVVGGGVYCCSSNRTAGGLIFREDPNSTDWELISFIQGGTADYFYGDAKGDRRLVFDDGDGYISDDAGITWTEIPQPPNPFGGTGVNKAQLEENGILASNFSGIYRSTDNGQNWTLLTSDAVRGFQVVGDMIVSMDNTNTLWRSTDSGTTWSQLNQLPTGASSYYFISEDIGFAYDVVAIHRTTDGGSTWNLVQSADTDTFIRFLDFSGSVGLASTTNGVVYKTTDQGANWSRINTTLPDSDLLKAIDENTWFSAENNSGKVYVSKDGGQTWVDTYEVQNDVNRIVLDGEKAYMIGDYTSFIEVKMNSMPIMPSSVNGNTISYVGREESYQLNVTNPDLNYRWEVDSPNSITYTGSQARISWEEAGTFTVRVIPIDACAEGTAREFEVKVVEEPDDFISGSDVVGNYSTENYSVAFTADVTYQWFVTGATSFTPNQNNLSVTWDADVWGEITLIITDNETGLRTVSSRRVAVGNALSVDDENLNNVLIYPNPANDYFVIRSGDFSKVNIKIYDVRGREFTPNYSKQNDNYIVELDGYAAGVYILKLTLDDKHLTERIIKE